MLISLHRVLPEGAAGGVPEWLHLVPAGTFRGEDGRGPYICDAAAVVAASQEADGTVRLPIDENHATDFAQNSGQPSPARGWIVELQARADGVWGRIEWCPAGRELMAERAYRGISPVFTTKGNDKTVGRLLRAALTNTPNLGDLHHLHTQETGVDLKKLRTALKLSDTADEAAILAAINERDTAIATHATQLGELAAAAGATAKDAAGIKTHLQSQRAAGDPKALESKVVELQSQLTTMQQSRAKEDAVRFVDGAIAAGKPIAALRDHYVTRHMAGPEAVEKEIGAMITLHSGGIDGPTIARHADGLGEDEPTEMESAVARRMGVDPKKLAEERRKNPMMKRGS